MMQFISVLGALIILIAFGLSQAGKMSREDWLYNVLNIIGSGLLAWVAIVGRQAGFILLEGAWAVLSIWALLKFRANEGA